MAENSSQEKTEQATPKRLNKLRDDGQVARAKELVTASILVVAIVTLYVSAAQFSDGVLMLFERSFSFGGATLADPKVSITLVGVALGQVIYLFIPLTIGIFVTTILTNLMIGGWLFSIKPVTPQFSRLSPLKGLKRMFSKATLVELIKSLIKVGIIFGILFLFLRGNLVNLIGLQGMSIRSGSYHIFSILLQGTLLIGSALVVFGALDIPYQLWKHKKDNKMTKQEVKEEHKSSEGKPEVKRKIRELQQAQAKSRVDVVLPNADIVIANPTHYAVALRYDINSDAAPVLLAKGVDEVAIHMQQLAKSYRIEVLHAPPLCRAVYFHCEVNQLVAEELYYPLAQALSYVAQMNDFKAGKRSRPEPPAHYDLPKNLQGKGM